MQVLTKHLPEQTNKSNKQNILLISSHQFLLSEVALVTTWSCIKHEMNVPSAECTSIFSDKTRRTTIVIQKNGSVFDGMRGLIASMCMLDMSFKMK